MAGKVWNISPWQGPTRIKGVAHTYYSPKFQRWITRSWPSTAGAFGPVRSIAVDSFTRTVKLIKQMTGEDRQAAVDLSAHTPYLTRDLLFKACQGTLLQFTDSEGRFWMSTRIAIQAIQPMLDSISPTPGAMLVRGQGFWDFVAPPADARVLLFDTATTLPAWSTFEDAIQVLLDSIATDKGALLVRDDAGWVAFAPGTAGDFLQTFGAGALPQWIAIPPPGPSPGDDVIAAFTAVPVHPGFDPDFIGTAVTLGSNNKTLLPTSGTPYNYYYGTTARYSGKWYLEMATTNISFNSVGFSTVNSRMMDDTLGSPGLLGAKLRGQVGWASDGTVKTGGGITEGNVKTISTIQTFANNNVLGMAIDITNKLAWFRTGTGNWNNSGAANPATGVGGIDVRWLFAGASTTMIVPAGTQGSIGTVTMHQISTDMVNGPPSGFSPWSGI